MTAPDEVAERIAGNRAAFEATASEASAHLRAGRLEAAVVYAGMAANLATHMHPGFFGSRELEELVGAVAAQALRREPRAGHGKRSAAPSRLLHVLTNVLGVGGHSRLAWRWIEEDVDRVHSVAVTRQGSTPLPPQLQDAVTRSGGRIHLVDRSPGSVLSRARRLRRVVAGSDMVVMHHAMDDMVPLLALADRSEDDPPTVYVDHGDHLFWTGVSVSDVVCALRESGRCLAVARRGVEARRSALMPIVLPPPPRTMTRAESRQRLGIAPDALVLLSVARPVKYRPIDGLHLLDVVLPLIRDNPRVHLLLVGPEPDPAVGRAARSTGGRVKALGIRTDVEPFHRAADVYLDSYPMVSTTSLLEAGSHGLPLISLCPSGETGSSIVCADAPGLRACLVQAGSVDEYRSRLGRLIEDEALRAELGQRTAEQITSLHTGPGWRRAMSDLYGLAAQLPPASLASLGAVGADWDQGDAMLLRLHSTRVTQHDLLPHDLRLLPLRLRVRRWLALAVRTGRPRPALLVPEWALIMVRPWLGRIRRHARSAGQ